MRLSAPLLALALLASGCADPDAPVVTTDDTVVVTDGDTAPDAAPDASSDIDEAEAAPDEISAVEAGEEVGAVSAAAAGEDAGAVETKSPAGDRPETKARAVSVEGEASTETLTLADFPSFPVPFSTYLRPGVTVEQPGSGDALSIEQGLARVLVTVPYESVDAAATRLRAALPGARDLDRPGDWARHGFYAYQGSDVTTIRIGEHDGTTFVVEESMPAEMGDGFSPTVEVLLDEWQWADGSAL